ncbi:excalibur calcium-binding domain-containing protein [Sphingobium sp. LSP13-1-1.1]
MPTTALGRSLLYSRRLDRDGDGVACE